jgi:PKD repeat protein
MLGAGAGWAAGNGTKALYIDWYDNIVAHSNALAPNPNEFLPQRALVSYTLEQNGLNVSFVGDIPNNLSEYDAVVIEAYWACEPIYEPIIRNYVSNGGGVILLGGVPCYFVYDSKTWWTGMDLGPIEEWFGASLYENAGGNADLVVDNPFGTSLQRGDVVFSGFTYSHAAVTGLDADARVLANWSMGVCFAFAHTYGQGRVYYQADFRTPEPLTADFTVSPYYIFNVRQPVYFDASSSRVAWNGTYATSIIEYFWDFGDGNVTPSATSNTTHTYLSSGLFNVTLTVFDDAGSNASYSQTICVKESGVLSISTETPSTFIGFSVGINGTLSDTIGNGLEDETILLYYTFQGASSWFPLTSAITDKLGRFYVQWIPTATGAFTIIAQWSGNLTISGSTTSVILNTMPYQNQYVFAVESNSTVLALAFDSADSKLTFTAEGPTDTTGYAKVTIAKSLVDNATNMRVYLDNEEFPYSMNSLGDSWILTFSYTHSIHNVSVSLNVRPVPELQLTTMLLLFTTTIVAIVIFKKRTLRRVRAR